MFELLTMIYMQQALIQQKLQEEDKQLEFYQEFFGKK